MGVVRVLLRVRYRAHHPTRNTTVPELVELARRALFRATLASPTRSSMPGDLGCVIMRPMRLAVSFAVLLLGVACGSALVPIQSLQPDKLQGASDSITIVSARFGSNCKGPSDDVTALFRQACDGKWRCAVRSSQPVRSSGDLRSRRHRKGRGAGFSPSRPLAPGSGGRTRGVPGRPARQFRARSFHQWAFGGRGVRQGRWPTPRNAAILLGRAAPASYRCRFRTKQLSR
jgi:hypothetical protein